MIVSTAGLLITPAERITVRLQEYTHPTRMWQETHHGRTEVHASYTSEAHARAAAFAIGAKVTAGQAAPIRVLIDVHTLAVLHDRPRGLHRKEGRR